MSIGAIGGTSSMLSLQQLRNSSSTQQTQSQSSDSDHDGDTDFGGVDNNDGHNTSMKQMLNASGKGQYINTLA
jgi:hypothetical protein